MHIDESKKYDKRNIGKDIKNGIINRKEYEAYLSKLPDASDKVFNLEEIPVDSEEIDQETGNGQSAKKKLMKKKVKGKAK